MPEKSLDKELKELEDRVRALRKYPETIEEVDDLMDDKKNEVKQNEVKQHLICTDGDITWYFIESDDEISILPVCDFTYENCKII
ncbi:MAG: hypothetical protein ACXQS2_00120 [Methermicoccaceae archaeon]